MRPFYEEVIAENRFRRDEMEALRAGVKPPRPDTPMSRFVAAALHEPDVFRAFLETRAALATTREVLGPQDVRERIERLASPAVMPIPGPDRSQLLELLAEPRLSDPEEKEKTRVATL